MVAETKRFKAEDDEVREKVEARNGLEQFCCTLINNVAEGNVNEKLSEADVKTIQNAVSSTLW